jgi:hypothetical protein
MNEEGRSHTKLFIGMSVRAGGATGAPVDTREPRAYPLTVDPSGR